MTQRTTQPGRNGEVVYQVYVRSFQDTNGDGVGDLPGITQRLDHIARLGADVVWLTPFFPSPMADFGYDVADYTGVDPLFGRLEDVDALIAAAHARGLRVIFDLVASHTSDRHAWFQESRADRTNPKADWYVWVDPKPDGTPPNNWLAVFGGPAWQWDAKRRQYYLHNFLVSQPDLNFHNSEVQDAILAAAKFWLDRGVDGFRLDVVNYYVHDAKLRNNPPAPLDRVLRVTTRTNPYGWQDHVYDHTRPETLAFVARLRALVDCYPGAFLMGELVTDRFPEKQARAYTAGRKRLHMVYSFDLFAEKLSTTDIRATVERIDRAIGDGGWVAWALSNHDVKRAVSRFGFEDVAREAAPALAALLGCLRGTVCLYQGEELGLVEADVPFEALQDPYGKAFWPEFKGRDGCRTPMPWAAGAAHLGFAPVGARPWLPLDQRHAAEAVDLQAADPSSSLSRIAQFLRWRRGQPALLTGSITFHDAPDGAIVIERKHALERCLVALNLSRTPLSFSTPAFADAQALGGHGFFGSLAGSRVSLPPFGAVFAAAPHPPTD